MLHPFEQERCKCCRIWQGLAGCISVLMIMIIILKSQHTPMSYETGFSTDLSILNPALSVVEKKFTGGLKYNEAGHLFRDESGDSGVYIGEPSPAMDRAWNTLLRSTSLTFTALDWADRLRLARFHRTGRRVRGYHSTS